MAESRTMQMQLVEVQDALRRERMERERLETQARDEARAQGFPLRRSPLVHWVHP